MNKVSQKAFIFWLSLSLTFAAIYVGWAIHKSFNAQYTVQDDARVYLIWMQRFVDPNLVKGDLIADYSQSVTPKGYALLYQFMAAVGISPLLFSKLLPIALGLLSSYYCFVLSLQLLPMPMAAFSSTLLLNQSLWLQSDILSATPRGFIYPLLLAFLYYLVRREWVLISISLLGLGLFYPMGLLLAAGTLVLQLAINWLVGKGKIIPILNQEKFSRKDSLLCLASLGVAAVTMLLFAGSESQFGPAVTLAEARTWVEFLPQGRIPFFRDDNPLRFWLSGQHSGIRLSLNPPLLAAAFLLPWLMLYPSRFPLTKQISSSITVLSQLVLVSFGWFFLAHAVLFKLYLPSRYTMHSLRIVLAVAAGLTLGILWDAAFKKLKGLGEDSSDSVLLNRESVKTQNSKGKRKRRFILPIIMLLVWLVLIFYPHVAWGRHFPQSSWVVGEASSVYEFLQKQPKDVVVASVSEEANNLPIFAQRSILVGREYANPYHVGYYTQFRERAKDLIRAQYSLNLGEIKSFIQKYRVSFWLLDSSAFTPEYLENNSWLQQYQPEASEAVARLKQGNQPILAKVSDRCAILPAEDLILLATDCIVNVEE